MIFSFFKKIMLNRKIKKENKKIEKEAVERAFKTGNVIIARKKNDGSVEWQEIEIKKQ